MRNLTTWMICLAAFVAASVVLDAAADHQAGLRVAITARDGAIRTVKLDGVGCTQSMCSRTRIKGTGERDALEALWLDGIRAIRDTTSQDALVVMKSGAQKRIGLVKDFRVLYLTVDSGSSEKLDLSDVKSLEFVAPSRK